MRGPIVLLTLLTAAPAAAMEIGEAERWSVEAHIVQGGTSRDTVIRFERTAPGTWSARAECQVTDVRTRKWTSHTGQGIVRLHQGFVVGELGVLGRVVVAGDRISVDDARCASGPVVLGTGD